MSAISASAGSGVSQFFQGIADKFDNSAANSSSNTSLGSAVSGHHHHHGGGGFAKLADAITSALQGAGSSSDPNQTITDALSKIFSNGSLGGTPDTDGDSEASTSAATTVGSTATTSATSNGVNELPKEFVQTLKSFGVTAQQFQSDITSALQQAQQSGTFDPSSVLKSLPPGSVLDAIG